MELQNKIIEVLAEEFEVDPSVISPDSPLMETLELDSLDLVDVVVLIEQNFGVTLVAPDFMGIVTFQDFVSLINRKMDEAKEA